MAQMKNGLCLRLDERRGSGHGDDSQTWRPNNGAHHVERKPLENHVPGKQNACHSRNLACEPAFPRRGRRAGKQMHCSRVIAIVLFSWSFSLPADSLSVEGCRGLFEKADTNGDDSVGGREILPYVPTLQRMGFAPAAARKMTVSSYQFVTACTNWARVSSPKK